MKNKKQAKETIDIRIRNFVTNHLNAIYFISLVLSLILSFKLFDIRVNLAGDDSAYIMRAFEFLKNGQFPAWQGPLYPMFLSILIAIFGVSVPILKLFSGLFLLASFYFLFQAMRNRVSLFLLLLTLFAVSLNSFIIFYGSFTYSEAFYLFLQAIMVFFLFRNILGEEKIKPADYIWLGLFSFLLYITRTVGIAAILSIAVYFTIHTRWKKLLYTLGSFAGFYLIFGIMKRTIWGVKSSQFASQLSSLLQKNAYNPAQGHETFFGMFVRFYDNSNLYLSKHFFRFLSLKPVHSISINPMLTITLYALLIFGFIVALRKHKKYIVFLFLYAGIFLGITFFSLQKTWDQDRLIVPVFPILVLIFAYSLVEFFRLKQMEKLRFVPYVFFAVVLFLIVNTTAQKVRQNKVVFAESIKGNQFFGFTPDWENYLRMSEYAGRTTGNAVVACRKPSNSFIYGKKLFKGIYSIPVTPIESVFTPGKVYYAIAVNNKLKGDFQLKMVKAIFFGLTNDNRFQSKMPYYLLQTDSVMPQPALKPFQVTLPEIKNAFSELTVYSPDQLLNNLRKDNTRYVIIANLRKIPSRKTNKTINTVARYMQIILMKYPRLMTKVHEVGRDEKAYLYRLNY